MATKAFAGSPQSRNIPSVTRFDILVLIIPSRSSYNNPYTVSLQLFEAYQQTGSRSSDLPQLDNAEGVLNLPSFVSVIFSDRPIFFSHPEITNPLPSSRDEATMRIVVYSLA